MSEALPIVYLARHGETAWSLTGQHTGLTDLPLTANGERNARSLGERLKGLSLAKVFTSPLQRAARSCDLAGFGAVAKVDRDLVEWDYGQYEGLRSAEIRSQRPDWQLVRDGCPGGESPGDVAARADREGSWPSTNTPSSRRARSGTSTRSISGASSWARSLRDA